MRIPGIFKAIANGDWDVVLKLKEDANKVNSYHEYPLHLLFQSKAPSDVCIAIVEAYPEAMLLLTKAGDTCFDLAIKGGWEEEKIAKLIEICPNVVKMKNKAGKLPLMVALQSGASLNIVTMICDLYPDAISEKDEKELSALIISLHKSTPNIIRKLLRTSSKAIKRLLEWAMEESKSILCVAAYLIHFDMPIDEQGRPCEHQYSYTWLLDLDPEQLPLSLCVDVIESVFVRFSKFVFQLAESEDIKGRPAINIPHKNVKRSMTQHLLFLGRYDLGGGQTPEHQSKTCILRLALDKSDMNDWKNVALKFMKHKDQFDREIEARKLLTSGQLDSVESADFVIGLTTYYDSAEFVAEASKRKGFEEYPYCLVMPAADRNLKAVLDHEHIAGKDWAQVKYILTQVAKCLDFMHSKGVIHGDLKPLNVMRSLGRYKLIDMDASVSFLQNKFSGAKYSSAFIPPELVHIPDNPLLPPAVRTYEEFDDGTLNILGDYDLVPAHPAHDIWSYGILAYQICADKTLFHSNGQDNLDNDSLRLLHDWTKEFKDSKLAAIDDPLARNFLSQILQKDPAKRPNIKRLLAHAFLSGKKAARLVGDDPQYDVFISYRVASDKDHVELLYNYLTARGLRVWWDRRCLKPGVSWEEGFCDGLADSLAFVPILSYDGINHIENPRQSFSMLTAESDCDNVLLEHRLALELEKAGLVQKIFPVVIGRQEPGVDAYGNYFAQKCYPKFTQNAGVVINKVESKLCEHLDRQSLGSPLIPYMPIDMIYAELTENQGVALSWTPETKEKAFAAVGDAIFNMIKNSDTAKLVRVATAERLRLASSPDQVRSQQSTGPLSAPSEFNGNILSPSGSMSRSLSQAPSQELLLQKPRPPSKEKPTRQGGRSSSEDKIAVRAMQDIVRAKDIEIEELTKEIQKLRHLYKHAMKTAVRGSAVAPSAATADHLGPEN